MSAGVCSLIVGNCSLPEDSFAGVVCCKPPRSNHYFLPIHNTHTIINTATAQSSVPGSVRLFGGDDYRSGVVEIHFDGRWGVICDDFTSQTAELACLELGYSSVNTRTIRPSSSRRYNGNSNTDILQTPHVKQTLMFHQTGFLIERVH